MNKQTKEYLRLQLALLRQQANIKEQEITSMKDNIKYQRKLQKTLEGQLETLNTMIDTIYQEFNLLKE